ncbi:hypothetical protein V6N13_149212 [Hibiscus sabdariffa]
MSQEQEQPAPASQSDQLSPTFDPSRMRWKNVKLFRILRQLNTSSKDAWIKFPKVNAMALPLLKKENPKYGKFRNKGLPFYNELTILFKDVTTTGEFAWAPSSGILPNGLGGNEGDEEDVYRPSPIDLDMEEGVSVIANSCKSHDGREAGTSIGEVLAELQTLDEVANDLVFHTNCCQLMMFKPAMETFIGLRGLEEKRIHWLRHAAYNPIPFMKM